MPSALLNKTVSFDQNTAATFTPVAAVTGKRIIITGYELVAGGANTIVFKDNTTALTGAIPVASGTRIGMPPTGSQVFATSVGNAFKVTLSSTGQVAGWFSYQVVE